MKFPNTESNQETQDPNPNSSKDNAQNLRQQSALPQTLNSQIPKQSPEEQAEEQEEEPEVKCMSLSSTSPSVNLPITDTHVAVIISDQDPVLENPPSMMSPTGSLVLGRGGTKRKKPMSYKTRQAFDKKLKTLGITFKPIPFRPKKALDFSAHEKLLKRLGLWDFVHVELERNIRTDVIAQLVVTYNSQKGCCFVNNSRISIRRSELAKALMLPWKKDKNNVVEVEGGEETVSQESIAFISDFVSNWVLLHEDTWKMPPEILHWTLPIKEGYPEKVDWASLMWFMVEKELAQGALLGHCFYASHLQCLIKSQREVVFFEAPIVDSSGKEEEKEEDAETTGTEEAEDLKTSDDSSCVKMSEDFSYSKTGVDCVGEIMTKESDGVKIVEELNDVMIVEELDDAKIVEELNGAKIVEVLDDAKIVEELDDVKITKDDTDVKMTEGDSIEYYTDVKVTEGVTDVKITEDDTDANTSKDECDLKMGKDECDMKMGVDDCDLMTEYDSSYAKMGTDGSDVKMNNGSSYKERGFEELSIEPSLGQDKSVKDHTVHEDAMDFENCKGQELVQWLLNGEETVGGHFLNPCNKDGGIVGEEDEKQENQDDQMHEREQEGEYTLLPRCNGIEANINTHFIEEIEASQVPYSSHMQPRSQAFQFHSHSVVKTQNDYEHGRAKSEVPWEQQETIDLGQCMENAQLWIGKAKMAYQAKEHNFINSNANQELLINELKQRDNVIEHLQKVMFEEQQRRHDIYRLERELFSMGNLLDEYKKALRENRRAFSEYRSRFPLPDEQPLYKDVLGGDGLVLTVAELERRHQKQVEEERMNLEVFVKEFETYWNGKFNAYSNMADMLESKLLVFEKEAKQIIEHSTERKAIFRPESTQDE